MAMKNLYKIDMNKIKNVNIFHANNTLKSIIKGMYKLQKEDININGMTGDCILEYCVKNNLWSTKQDRNKYHTTWNFYIKELKENYCVIEVGKNSETGEEYLE